MKLHLFIALAITLLPSTSGTNDEQDHVHSSRGLEEDEAFRQLNPGDKIPGSFIVTFSDDISKQDLLDGMKGVVNKLNGKRPLHSYSKALKGAAFDGLTDAQVAALESIDGVTVVQDQKVSINKGPPGGGGGGGTSGCSPTIPWGVVKVNGGAEYGNGPYTAWVIDTGIQSNHPDLNVDTDRSKGFIYSNGGYSFEDGNGHGTHVAGTIAAKGVGVTGVAKGATVVAVRVLGSSGSGSTSGVIAGIEYVAANAAEGDVANMSLGGGVSSVMDTAVINAAASGVRFALAAGNSAASANTSSPARANGPNIYTVSAFDINGNWASFSNYGNPPIDYAGPGVAVCSTTKGSGYATLSGTSMAAPHVAGILLWTAYGGTPATNGLVNGDPDGTPDQIMVVPSP